MISRYSFFIFSENPDKLKNFYTDVLGFEIEKKIDIPNDYGYSIMIAPGYKIWIGSHSQVSGFSKEPYRHILNLYDDHIQPWYEKIKKAEGVSILLDLEKTPGWTPENPRYVFTFLDPEGNCIQFMGEL